MIIGVISEYLVAARVAWHGELAIVNRNWNSCSEIRIYTPPRRRRRRQERNQPGCPDGLAQLFLRFRHFLSSSPPAVLPTEDFMAFQAAAVAKLSFPQFSKVEKINISFKLHFSSLNSQMLEQINPRDMVKKTCIGGQVCDQPLSFGVEWRCNSPSLFLVYRGHCLWRH